jgi:hypothetical protein
MPARPGRTLLPILLLAAAPGVAWARELGTLERVGGVAGGLFTLAVIGAALVTFAGPVLETVSDTVAHSFARAFAAGLVAQVLVIPTAGLVIGGLALTLIGLLVVPFAAIVATLLVLTAVILGLLAIAHAMGEKVTRRRMARGVMLSPNGYRYLLVGLGGMGMLWAGWMALGWIPVAGTLMLGLAVVTTWFVATVGFGATLLSRAGLRGEFAGRILPPESLTDEYLWATPQLGVTAVKRPRQ